MQYIISVTTMLTLAMAFAILKRRRKTIQLKNSLFRQSTVYNLLKDILPTNQELREEIISQSKKHRDENTVKVVVAADKCYWVLNNTFYCADLVDESVDPTTTQVIQTHDMSKQELNQLLEILDLLRSE